MPLGASLSKAVVCENETWSRSAYAITFMLDAEHFGGLTLAPGAIVGAFRPSIVRTRVVSSSGVAPTKANPLHAND